MTVDTDPGQCRTEAFREAKPMLLAGVADAYLKQDPAAFADFAGEYDRLRPDDYQVDHSLLERAILLHCDSRMGDATRDRDSLKESLDKLDAALEAWRNARSRSQQRSGLFSILRGLVRY